jgi:hypothetical protein
MLDRIRPMMYTIVDIRDAKPIKESTMATTRSYRLHRLALTIELGESDRRAERNRLEREVALRERTAPGIAPVEPGALMALFHTDRNTAWALLAAMTSAQRINQAIETACWLEGTGVEVAWGAVLERWEARLEGGERSEVVAA